jgi:hypothetical protein
MAATLTESRTIDIGQSQALCFGTIALDSSFLAAGEPIDATGDLGYSDLWITGTSSGYVGSWDAANQKLLMYRQTAATGALVAVPDTTDLSAVTVHYGAIRVK